MIGDVAGKTAVLVDDMIGTAGTLKAAAQTVIDEGATRVYAAATHAVFSEVTAENLASANFEQVVVTDTIPIRPTRRRTSASSPAPTSSRTRSARSSPTAPCRRCSAARTSCSERGAPAGAAGPGRRRAAGRARRRPARGGRRRPRPPAGAADPARPAGRGRGAGGRAGAAALGAARGPGGAAARRAAGARLRALRGSAGDARRARLRAARRRASRPGPGAFRPATHL